MKKTILTLTVMLVISLFVWGGGIGYAKVTGRCDNCHTMHNSQGGADLYASGPYEHLLAGDCVGCHSHGSQTQSYDLGTSTVPVVNYTGGEPPTYLAGGNFYWVQTEGGTDMSDAKGHNVFASNPDGTLDIAPGDVGHAGMCNDCHGSLATASSGCKGCHREPAHHADDGTGTKYVGASPWYRFLSGHNTADGSGVAGIEHSGWGPSDGTVGGINHNEYLGVPEAKTDYTGLTNKSMTAFCSGCHGNFHIEQDSSGNWIRHPSDAVIPNTEGSEYASMSTLYNPDTPVARPSGFNWAGNTPSSTVAAGTDMVMCLSCHRAHASKYDDLLRWNYSTMIAGEGSNTNGCFVCHTTKDN